MKKIYFDNAASTPIDPQVLNELAKQLKDNFGNSESLHFAGQLANKFLKKSRSVIAKVIKAKNNEIIFTSSATESNNLAIFGIAEQYKGKDKTIIVSSIEHESVLDPAKELEKQGFKIKIAPVDKFGIIKLKELEKLIDNDTILISIMHANNEIGTMEPINEIAKLCHKHNVLLHTDAAQTLGKTKIDVKKLGVDLLTGSSHKIYGPKGAAFLYVKSGIKIEPQILGGGQEFGLRSSSVNVPAIAAFAKALEIADQETENEQKKIRKLSDYLIKQILAKIPNSYLTGHPKKRLANINSFRFSFVEGESILMMLNEKGIAVSTGSACSTKDLQASHVLLALGLTPDQAHGSLRISLGRFNTMSEINYLIKVLPKIIKKLRKISPYSNK